MPLELKTPLLAISQRLGPAKRCATNLVMLMKLSGIQKQPELNNLSKTTIAVRSSFFLLI